MLMIFDCEAIVHEEYVLQAEELIGITNIFCIIWWRKSFAMVVELGLVDPP
jgi:hypothetical protein